MPLTTLFKDLRYAARGLRRDRAFTATTVATLAVAFALVTVVFTVFNAYVLRPFAVRDPNSLYGIGWRSQTEARATFTWQDVQALGQRRDLFDAVISESTAVVSSSDGRQLLAGFVSGDYFETLSVRMALGRPLAAFDATAPGSAPVAVLSHDRWERLFASDPSILGRTIELNGHTITVVGVVRPEFTSLGDTPRDVWLPITMYPVLTSIDLFGAEQPSSVHPVARLRRDVTAAGAAAALAPLVAAVMPGRTDMRAEVLPNATPAPLSLELLAVLSPVFAAFSLVLIAACANVSNVMLARAQARQREIGVRLAIGASRGRLVRQLLTEGLLISGIAAAAGLGLAALMLRAGVSAFVALLPASLAGLARVVPLDLDYRVLVFGLIVSSLATCGFALLPALQATRVSLNQALRGQGASGVRNGTLRGGLVVCQIAISLVLLIAAATLMRNASVAAAADLGIVTEHVTSIRPRTPGAALIPKAVAALERDSRFAPIAVASHPPLSEVVKTVAVTPQQTTGAPDAAGTPIRSMAYRFVSPEYVGVLGIPVLRGRNVTAEEARSESPVAMISSAAAQALWPGADPIGRVLTIERPGPLVDPALDRYPEVTIVGVVGDVVSGLVFEGLDASQLYLPTHQGSRRAATILARSHPGADLQPQAWQDLMRPIHPDPNAFDLMPLGEMVEVQTFPFRAAALIGWVLSGVALALSVSGLYGVMVYTWTQRTKEIGIRIALGATPAVVIGLVLRQSARLVGGAAAAGLAVMIAAMTTLQAFVPMQNASYLDPWAILGSLAAIAAAAALATYVPARRAASVEPAATLRAEG